MPIYYGAAYYPEQWPAERWEEDARLMAEAGINAVRLGEFAWGRMESAPGQYHWEWLDRVLELLQQRGIGAVLCTPTAGPPPWVVDLCPGMLPMDLNRTVRPIGGRRHYCPNNSDYRRYSVRIATALATRYGNHPAVIGWEIDNEFGLENTGRCYCPVCAEAFRVWLKHKYGTLEALNRAWGTIFWSQEYQQWEQIQPPMQGVRPDAPPLNPRLRQNPAWLLDYERFSSQSFVDYQNLQVDAVRAHTKQPICHNGTGIGFDRVNYYDLFRKLDRGGYDCYPSVVSEDFTGASRNLAQARRLTAGPSWILELSSGGGLNTWGDAKPQAPPGSLRLVAWQVFANGAEMALYFQWRMFAKGAEQLESALLDLDGVPRRKYEEARRTAAELKRLAPWLTDTKVRAEVGLVWCYDHHWAHAIKPYSPQLDYNAQGQALYSALLAQGVGVDVISLEADLSAYRAVVIPSPILMRPDIAERLKRYVKDGGVVLTTFLTGVKDWDNGGFTDRPVPGYLDELFGVTLTEVDPGHEGLPTQVALQLPGAPAEAAHSVWSDILEPHGATVLGRLQGSYRNGEPVLTRNLFGKGYAYYLGTWLEEKALRPLLSEMLDKAGVKRSPLVVPQGVEQVQRAGAGKDLVFLLNWTYTSARVTLDRPYRDLLTDREWRQEVEIPARDLVALAPIS